MFKIKLILCFTILSFTSGLPSISKFRDDYTYSEETHYYYKIYRDKFTWHDAVSECISEGAQLFYPENEGEARVVDSLLGLHLNQVNPIWIGVSDMRSDRVFETVDGRPLDEVYNKWDTAFGQPAMEDYSYHCVAMWQEWDDSGLWLRRCTEGNSFICKYDPRRSRENFIGEQSTTDRQLMLMFLAGLPKVSKFRDDYNYSEETRNYYKVYRDKFTWHNAVSACMSEGAQLFYPENEGEARVVDSLLGLHLNQVNPIWIGVSDMRSDRVFETIDGRPLDEVYNKWDTAYFQPAMEDYSYHCVAMWQEWYDSGLWLRRCTEGNSFICKYDPRPGLPSVSKFRDDYTYSEETGNYYKVYKDDVSWHNAVSACMSDGAQLFYPESEWEARVVDSIFGLHVNQLNPIWIGVSDMRSDRVFETIDGRPMDEVYNKWDTAFGQPSKEEYGYHCVAMWLDPFWLWLLGCGVRNSFICKYDPRHSQENGIGEQSSTDSVLENMETSTMDKTPVKMNGGYLSIGEDTAGLPSVSKFRSDYTYSEETRNYYKVYKGEVSWYNAVSACKSEEAQLFYPESEWEASVVESLFGLYPNQVNPIWIGVSDLRSDRVFETIDGRPLDEVYHKWDTAFGQPPAEKAYGYHCVILWKDGKDEEGSALWLDRCSVRNSFICKYDPRRRQENGIDEQSSTDSVDKNPVKMNGGYLSIEEDIGENSTLATDEEWEDQMQMNHGHIIFQSITHFIGSIFLLFNNMFHYNF